MSFALGVVMDPISQINYKKDSTLAMLLAAKHHGCTLYYMQIEDLYLSPGSARGHMRSLDVFADPDHWYELGNAVDTELSSLDAVLMRTDPPFNMEYIYATYILAQAQREGCLIVNDPNSVRDCNEKLFATEFSQCCPPLVVSSNATVLRRFHAEHGDVIYKPLDGMGGTNIFKVDAKGNNLGVILESLTAHGRTPIMAQRYIPEIKQGDKRILMINGEPIPYALARIPSDSDHRGNLAAGGTGEARPLTDRDRWICEQIGPTLKEKGLVFVGLDVIGDYLTEINVTSPTCIREIDAAYNTRIGDQLIRCIQSLLDAR
ncbi:MAG: glutathione synthase [Pseudomonadota bacterium]